MSKNKADRKAEAAAAFDALDSSLASIARIRSQLDEIGQPMPEQMRQDLLALRQTLRPTACPVS